MWRALLFLISFPGIVAAADRPNVLFIAVDDLRCEFGCYGVKEVISPNLDRLAASGVAFSRAYCQQAVCNPSRVSVMTGLRPDTTKVWDLVTEFRTTIPDAVTIPQHFRKHGYRALGFGKIFHNPFPDNESWDEPHKWPEARLWSEDAKQELADFRTRMHADGKSKAAIERMRALGVEKVDYPEEEHTDVAIAQQAIDAMRALARDEKPFFLAAGFVRPHLPFVVPRKYWDLYDPTKIPLAENTFLPRGAPAVSFGEKSMGGLYELRDYMDFSAVPSPFEASLSQAEQRELKHGYYASVSFIDAQVGRLLDELDKLGIADSTIVLLWSDHGWKLGEHNGWCKQTNYEIDARAPLMIRAPGMKANGTSSSALTEFVDIYPTLCELASLPVPEELEGESLVPILKAESQDVKDAAFSQFPRTHDGREFMGIAIRTDRFRYIEWRDLKTGQIQERELYDHETDPQENENVAPRNTEVVAQLSDRLAQQFDPADWKPVKTAKKAERPTLTIVNEGRQALDVYWLPEKGESRKAGRVDPGQSHVIQTTLGHRFSIEGTENSFREVITVTSPKRKHTVKGEPSPPPAASKPKAAHPNILFLMADDWSWPHAGALGDAVVRTPTFDRIVREGVLFENAFVASPSCTPSRHAVVSGQYHWRLGEGVNLGGSLPADVPVYPDLLATAGYHTGFSRKGAAPSEQKFRGTDPFGPKFKNFTTFLAERPDKTPFCYWYGAGEPHRPYDWQASLNSDLDLSKMRVPACLPNHETVRTDLGDYNLRVEQFDRFAGEMLAELEKRGELETTIVVMTGDNGMPFPRCKATLYDTGTRVPLAIRWGAKVKGGRTVKDFVSLTDLAPTFLEASGLAVPVEMTGRSLLSLLTSDQNGQIDPKRDHVLTGMEQHVYPNPSRAIRTAEFLYIRNFDPATWPTGEVKDLPTVDYSKTPWPTVPGSFSHNVDPSPTKQWMIHNPGPLNELAFGIRAEEELFDLKKDPDQLHNVAAESDYAEIRTRISNQLAAELRAGNDPRFAGTRIIREIRGWKVHIHRDLIENERKVIEHALKLLTHQLNEIIRVVPAKAVEELRKVPLYFSPPYEGKRQAAEFHPDAGWLEKNGRDPAMARAVEFTNTRIFEEEMNRMPNVTLHELAHAYHFLVVRMGFSNLEIKRAYERARASGTYDRVERWHGNGKPNTFEAAYAMTTPQEYFAETTEAYFSGNDFFPFNREELQKHDPEMFALLEKLWETTSN